MVSNSNWQLVGGYYFEPYLEFENILERCAVLEFQ